MFRRLHAFYNPWFILPFLVWAVLGISLLLAFDRMILFSTVNLHHTALLDRIMIIMTKFGQAEGIIPVLLFMLVFRSCRNWWYILAAFVCNGAPAIFIQILKGIFNAPRPFEYYKADPGWIHFDAAWGHHLLHHSFPSGHAAGAFSMCCFLSMILPKRLSWLGTVVFFLALFICYTRMYLAAHFYADVYVGSLIGTTTTIFCFALMRRWSNQSFEIVPGYKKDIEP